MNDIKEQPATDDEKIEGKEMVQVTLNSLPKTYKYFVATINITYKNQEFSFKELYLVLDVVRRGESESQISRS